MPSPISLDVLATPDHRNALLLAEVAAWLHDMGKCTDELIKAQSLDRSGGFDYKRVHSSLVSTTHVLSLLGESVSLKQLIEEARPRIASDPNRPWIVRTLGRCHSAPHIEKEEPLRQVDPSAHQRFNDLGRQPSADTRLSSPFGHETPPVVGLTRRLKSLPFDQLTTRSRFLSHVQRAFSHAPGDTRRPENEVTLWDWSSSVAALYKAALAGALLGTKPNPNSLRWRFLGVRVDGADFIERSSRIPDLLARQGLLADGLDRVRTLLEETYPLSSEVYRDENGSLFIVPDLPKLLELKDDHDKELAQLIGQEFAKGTLRDNPNIRLGGEILPEVTLDDCAWWGQSPDLGKTQPDEVPPIGKFLQKRVVSQADPKWMLDQWIGARADLCMVCGLRPQGPGDKAKSRKVCETCERRRADRAAEWTTALHTTIWMDEVADGNGRLALVVGKFDLNDWLADQDRGLVQTLLVLPQDASVRKPMPKNPSFARLRRVWETTRRFWHEILPTELGEVPLATSAAGRAVGQMSPRLFITARNAQELDLGPHHAYDLVLAAGGPKLSVLSLGDGRFLTADNVSYVAQLLGEPERIWHDRYAAAMKVRDWLLAQGPFDVEQSTGYGSPHKLKGSLRVTNVEPETSGYTPAIPILAEPRTFMALVPADKALAVVRNIKAKYEREMGKVRNRLPLTLGLVFFPRRTPLRAALDAGRGMLSRGERVAGELWQVEATDGPINTTDLMAPSQVTLTLSRGGRSIPVSVPLVMGDGKTRDVWYPYWFIQADGTRVDDRRHRFKAWRPTAEGGELCWLVHAAELKPGDHVYFTPSTLDFEFLATTGRRFEISYTAEGRRRGRFPRPYLLEELDELDRLWNLLSERLAVAQINGLTAMIQTKRQAWHAPGQRRDDKTYEHLLRDVLLRANWKASPTPDELDRLVKAAVSAMLSDVIELHLAILKERPRHEADEPSAHQVSR